jgi:membrane protease YdiL (CAAX protease family)
LWSGLGAWGVAVGILLACRYLVGPVVPVVADNLKAVAVLVFLYLPVWRIGKRGEGLRDYGLHFDHWRRDLLWGLGTILVVYPPFVALFWGFVEVLPHLPGPLADLLAPYRGAAHFSLRVPPDLSWLLVTHLLVVALPEELFYRGFLWARLREGLGEGRLKVLGVPVGSAFLLVALTFALGHLTEPYPWRLAVFFPALLFGWLRVRSDGLLAPILVHGLSNVLMAILEASFFGP